MGRSGWGSPAGLSDADGRMAMWIEFFGEGNATFFPHIEQHPVLILQLRFPQMFSGLGHDGVVKAAEIEQRYSGLG